MGEMHENVMKKYAKQGKTWQAEHSVDITHYQR
jgi:hypothetical protein